MTNAIEVGIWADQDGTVLYSDCSGRLRSIDPKTGIVTTVAGGTSIHDGGPATEAFVSNPRGLAVGPDGAVYIADMQSDRVRRVDAETGVITTVAGSGGRGFGGNGGPATEAYFLNPYDVTVDPGRPPPGRGHAQRPGEARRAGWNDQRVGRRRRRRFRPRRWEGQLSPQA